MNEFLNEILGLLATQMGDRIKTYYIGEVVDGTVPKSNLPALMVIPVQTRVNAKTTASDIYEYSAKIKVVVDIMNYVEEGGVDTVIEHQADLIELMEGVNDNDQLRLDSVLGVLRAQQNIRGSKFLYINNGVIDYSVIQNGKFRYAYATLSIQASTDLKRRVNTI